MPRLRVIEGKFEEMLEAAAMRAVRVAAVAAHWRIRVDDAAFVNIVDEELL